MRQGEQEKSCFPFSVLFKLSCLCLKKPTSEERSESYIKMPVSIIL